MSLKGIHLVGSPAAGALSRVPAAAAAPLFMETDEVSMAVAVPIVISPVTWSIDAGEVVPMPTLPDASTTMRVASAVAS